MTVGCDGADLVRRDRAGRGDLLHEIIVPLAFHLDVGAGAEFDRLDQIVVDVGVDTGLAERIESRAGRAAANEPGFEILLRRVVELRPPRPSRHARRSDAAGYRGWPANARTSRFADLRGQRILAGQRPDLAVEHHVGRISLRMTSVVSAKDSPGVS